MGIAADFLGSAAQLEKQRSYPRSYRLEGGLLVSSLSVHQPRPDLTRQPTERGSHWPKEQAALLEQAG